MQTCALTRRACLFGAAALSLAAPALAAAPALHVRKDPGCGCCDDWVAVMNAAGFATTIELVETDTLAAFKRDNGIPATLASCHTAEISGYLVEGHVPAADIARLLAERPDAIGLAVPGMPWGAPGMGVEAEREAYDVFLIRKGGQAEIFARYPAA